MPYRSAKQRRFMHARHPGIARRWDEEYGGKVVKKRLEQTLQIAKRNPLKPPPTYDSYDTRKPQDVKDWKNIVQLEDERARHRRTKRQGMAAAGAGATGLGAMATLAPPKRRGRLGEDTWEVGNFNPGENTHHHWDTGSKKGFTRKYTMNTQPTGRVFESIKPSGVHFSPANGMRVVSRGLPAAGYLGAAALGLGGLGAAAYGSAQDRRKARMVAQRRKQRARRPS